MPSYGFTDVGAYRETFDYYDALLEVADGQKIELRWRGRDGKVRKSVPAVVREAFPERLADLRSKVGDARRTLSAQKDRLERLLHSIYERAQCPVTVRTLSVHQSSEAPREAVGTAQGRTV